MADYGQVQEEKELWKQRNKEQNNNWDFIFRAFGSSTNNPKKLAQILTVLDLACHQLKWDIPKVNNAGKIVRMPFRASDIVNAYQAGIDGKYHNDLVDIAKLDEYIQKKALMRKAQMMQDNTLMT